MEFSDAEISEYEDYWSGLGMLEDSDPQHVTITTAAIEDVEQDEAAQLMLKLRGLYVQRGYPNYKRWAFQASSDHETRLFRRLKASGAIERLDRRSWRLTDSGREQLMERDPEGPAVVANLQGDVIHGSKITATVTGSTLGALAVGDGSAATNTVDGSTGVTQEQLRGAIREAQIALVDDQDALAQVDARLFEALNQFLRMARETQVEQKALAEVQAKMKETLDEVWAKQLAPDLKSRALPETLKVIQALATSPSLAEIAKQLISQGV
jgi:hypothetical protein